jgi:hypothetical protein
VSTDDSPFIFRAHFASGVVLASPVNAAPSDAIKPCLTITRFSGDIFSFEKDRRR